MDITDNIPLHQGNIPRSEVIVLTKMPLTFDITANKSSVHKFDSAMPFVIYIAISVNEVKNSLLCFQYNRWVSNTSNNELLAFL